MLPLEKRIKIFVGATGSGKTEWCLNLATWLAEEGRRVYLVDMDTINPYFTLRERKRDLGLGRLGVEIISLPERALFSDLPLVPPHLISVLSSDTDVIIDVGGDEKGARALGQFSDFLKKTGYSMYMVINVFRPQTSTVNAIVALMRSIEKVTRLRITGLINNSNMLGETSERHVLRGQRLLKEVSEETGVPFIGSSVLGSVSADFKDIEGGLWRINRFLSNAWEVRGGGKGRY